MGFLTGKKAAFKIGTGATVKVLKLENWSISVANNIISADHFDDDGWTTKEYGTSTYSGSVEGSWNVKDDTTGQRVLQTAALNKTKIQAEFYTDEDSTEPDYKGTVLLGGFDVGSPVNDRITISMPFEGDGKLIPATYTTPATLALSASSPLDNATGVAVSVSPTMTFNNEISTYAVTMINTATLAIIAAAMSLDVTNKILTINPNTDLAAATSYAIIASKVTDIYGQSLADTVINFTTA